MTLLWETNCRRSRRKLSMWGNYIHHIWVDSVTKLSSHTVRNHWLCLSFRKKIFLHALFYSWGEKLKQAEDAAFFFKFKCLKYQKAKKRLNFQINLIFTVPLWPVSNWYHFFVYNEEKLNSNYWNITTMSEVHVLGACSWSHWAGVHAGI